MARRHSGTLTAPTHGSRHAAQRRAQNWTRTAPPRALWCRPAACLQNSACSAARRAAAGAMRMPVKARTGGGGDTKGRGRGGAALAADRRGSGTGRRQTSSAKGGRPSLRGGAHVRPAHRLQSHSHAGEGPRRESHLLPDARQCQHAPSDVSSGSKGGRQECLGRMEVGAGTAQQGTSEAHPRGVSIRARVRGGTRVKAAGRVLHQRGGEARAHGSMAGLSVLHEREQAKAPMRRAAGEELQRDVLCDSPSRHGSQGRCRRRQARKLRVVQDG